jgi:nickel/cobalt transporter (NicO) family protein
LIQQGSFHAWLYFPGAILLGAMHGLEPGHSKTMMAAFIIAIRGTISQAILLGLSAALSHSLLVWVIAGVGLYYDNRLNLETFEPYFQLVSAFIIAGMALWMLWRTRCDIKASESHSHDHHHHDHGHGEEAVTIDTGHGVIKIAIFEEGTPPVFRLSFFNHGRNIRRNPAEINLETIRSDGTRQSFAFSAHGDALQSTANIPEPHEFELKVKVSHGDHSHSYSAEFHEQGHHHDHSHGAAEDDGAEYQDAHERAHASDIEQRFAGRRVTTGQIILFGISGGLMPCPAAVTVLIICLQLKQLTLGFALVAAFSLGLALTMVTTGVVAAWSVHHAEKRFKGFGELMRKAPYVSVIILLVVATYIGLQAWHGIFMQTK